MSNTMKIVTALVLAVAFRLVGGLLGEVAAALCVIAALAFGVAAWRRDNPRPGEELSDEEAHRIEAEKLARFSTKP